MKRMNAIAIAALCVIVVTGLVVHVSTVDARRGCCSWHGGVCGCMCCDGTPLSAKCAPYYPSCNEPPRSYSTSEPTHDISINHRTRELCQPGLVSQPFCKGNAVYQKLRMPDCTLIDTPLMNCSTQEVCRNGICEPRDRCGDGVCGLTENCWNCKDDCGPCHSDVGPPTEEKAGAEAEATGMAVEQDSGSIHGSNGNHEEMSLLSQLFSLFLWILSLGVT